MKLSSSFAKAGKFLAPLFLTACTLTGSAAPVAPTIVDRGAHHRVWQTSTERRYTELASCLHYQQDGQWRESKEEIELFPNGAVARQGQTQVIFSPNANTVGAIDLLGVDGKRFRTRILGLAYFDAVSGNSALIAEIKDSVGQLTQPNQVIYPDALTDCRADVRYTYRKGSFEQDIILRESPPSPLQYGLPPESTRLQVWTEFFDPPPSTKQRFVLRGEQNPELRALMNSPDFADELISFGQTIIGRGKAFAIENEAGRNLDHAIPVGKEWATVDGRTFLVESVEYPAVKPLLDTLPLAAALKPQNNQGAQFAVNRRQIFPSRSQMVASIQGRSDGAVTGAERPDFAQRLAALSRGATNAAQKIRKASTAQISALNNTKGVVLDYITLSVNTNNFTFRSDSTYLITAPVTFGGVTRLEPTTCIKFVNTNTAQIIISGASAELICPTNQFRHAILTAKDDNSYGEEIATSTGTPTNYYATYGLYFLQCTNPVSKISNVRISYAQWGIYWYGYNGHQLSHSQLISCERPLVLYYSQALIRNVLAYDASKMFYGETSSVARCENVTFCKASELNYTAGLNAYLTNCLLVELTVTGPYSGANNNSASSASAVFQTVGAGSHYLNSSWRNSGTTNIDATLLAELRKRTTYPPLVLSNYVTLNTTLTPQAQRDTDAIDGGYHYDPIDYLVFQLIVTNATLRITNGTVIAPYDDIGIWLRDGSQLFCEGTPLQPNKFVRYYAVQEKATVLGPYSHLNTLAINPYNYGNAPPSATLRFTDFIGTALGGNHLYCDATSWTFSSLTVQDCNFISGSLAIGGPNTSTILLKNNLFEQNDYIPLYYEMQLTAYNNLFKGNLVEAWNSGSSTWVLKDNIFDTCTLWNDGTITNSHNAYVNTSDRLIPTNGTEKVLSSLAYETGFLGYYYLPQSSSLINAGSRDAANANFYFYTTTTNQVAETNSIVDIGLHVPVATSATQGLDTDSDGWLNVSEDSNGNGVFESGLGETDWQNYNSIYGIGTAPGLVVFTPLK